MTPRIEAFFLGALLVAGCGPGGVPDAAVTSVDSAGVELVTLAASARSAAWTVSEEPRIEIGLGSGDAGYLFEGVVSAMLREDGTLVVCNGGDRTLRLFDSDGVFRARLGGRGGGPSELRALTLCLRVGEEIFAYQAPFQPIKVYGEEEGFRRSIPMPRPGDRPAVLLGVFPDGSLLLRQDGPRGELEQGSDVLHAALVRASTEAAVSGVDTLALVPAGRWVRSGPLSFPEAFSPVLQAGVVDGMAFAAWSAEFDVLLSTPAGAPVRRLRRRTPPLRVTGGHRSAFEDRILFGPMPEGDVSYGAEDVRRAIVDMMTYPQTLPAHYRVLVDLGGLLWIERGDAPRDPLPHVAEAHAQATTWDAVGTSGEWLGTIRLPARFDPLEIGPDYVLGVHHDEIGVERIRSYGLSRGGA